MQATSRVIWSVCQTDGMDEIHILDVMRRAVREGVSGIEIVGRNIDRVITYREFSELHDVVNPTSLAMDQAMLDRICACAAALGLRLGIWHHEVSGPADLFTRLPALRAEDGLLALDSPVLYRFITGKCTEFLERFPVIQELVLTLTETNFVVSQRPFCDIPPVERIRRILQAVADATEPLGRRLVVRPFSAVRADEIYVREAMDQLQAKNVSIMYKTEPGDWNPFLPDEPSIGSFRRYEIRTETDAGAEYYGQADFPCCYARFIRKRLESAIHKGATVCSIRVDRGSTHNAFGHPLNEVNVMAPTRWVLQPGRDLDSYWRDWWKERYGAAVPAPVDVLERTFEVIQKTLYINGHSITHHAFPAIGHAKHIQVFHLFEEDVLLDHFKEHWATQPLRRTLRHEEILKEKEAAVALAAGIREEFTRLSSGLEPAARGIVCAYLARLELLAGAFLQFCRVSTAHLEEMWEGQSHTVAGFDVEARRMLQLADAIQRAFGPGFFRGMPERMKEIVAGLQTERAMEMPLRDALCRVPHLTDAVLCGFASEGHRLAKRLHTGATPVVENRHVRETGIGPDEGFGYELKAVPGKPHRLTLDIVSDGQPFAMAVSVGGATKTLALDLPAGIHAQRLGPFVIPDPSVRIKIWSPQAKPCQVAALTLQTEEPG